MKTITAIIMLIFLLASCNLSDELLTKKDALNLLFDYVYDDESKAGMTTITFSDTDEFYGYEYRRVFNGELANPYRIEFWDMSEDNKYYIFWLNEQVYHDGVFDHTATGNFFAVNIETQDIITERNYTETSVEWNEEFPW